LQIIQTGEREHPNKHPRCLLAALQEVFRHTLLWREIFTLRETTPDLFNDLRCGNYDVFAGNLTNRSHRLIWVDDSIHSYAVPVHRKRRDVEIRNEEIVVHLKKVRNTYPSLRRCS